jgi:uncharacterized iron-regulated protein
MPDEIEEKDPVLNKQQTVFILRASVLAALSATSAAQNNTQQAITRVLSVYEHHDVVLMGEQHGLGQNHDFRVALVKHPDFPDIVNDIVIESGDALYQKILDNYVFHLKIFPDKDLQKIWRNTTQTSGV